MSDDLPAAHSMDTHWFAVDEDGFVGYFSTGEGGAMPPQADTDWREAWNWAAQIPDTAKRWDLEGFLNPPPRQDFLRHACAAEGPVYGEVCRFLKSVTPLDHSLRAGDCTRWDAGDVKAIVFERLAPALVRRLHESGNCLGCFRLSGYEEAWVVQTSMKGFFAYAHPTYYY